MIIVVVKRATCGPVQDSLIKLTELRLWDIDVLGGAVRVTFYMLGAENPLGTGPPEMAEHVASVLLRPSAGFRQVRDEDLRVEVGAEIARQGGPRVGQGGALAVL